MVSLGREVTETGSLIKDGWVGKRREEGMGRRREGLKEQLAWEGRLVEVG